MESYYKKIPKICNVSLIFQILNKNNSKTLKLWKNSYVFWKDDKLRDINNKYN